MNAIYNEIEPFACDWLEALIAGGHIAAGRVERRSITELRPIDVAGPGQRHFFAGIAGWSAACRLAGVPDDADIWTGSCPCQPFSDAGTRSGVLDTRHLWPAWFDLIRECRPAAIFGEQVASRDGLAWLDLVRADLERCGYAFGASDLCAAGVGSPHRRQRLYFMAYTREGGRPFLGETRIHDRGQCRDHVARCGPVGGMADSEGERCRAGRMPGTHGRSTLESERLGSSSELADVASDRRIERLDDASLRERHRPASHGGTDGLGDAVRDGRQDRIQPGTETRTNARELPGDEAQHEVRRTYRDHPSFAPGATRGFWARPDWLFCRDGKWRPAEPGSQPLAYGVPGRVGLLRGYGNGIVPEVAASFIRAARAAVEETRR